MDEGERMKKSFTLVVAALVLLASNLMPVTTFAQGKSANRAGQHPWILRAISALEAAKYDLEHAAHDFCGHRANALEATDNAIRQLGLALSCEPHGNAPGGGAAGPGGGRGGRGGEKHPMIRKAINALERAREDLQRAGDNFCGHKADA